MAAPLSRASRQTIQAPTVSISQGSETVKEPGKDAGRDAGVSAHESGTLGFAPRLSRPFALQSGAKVEPYVSLDRKLALEQQSRVFEKFSTVRRSPTDEPATGDTGLGLPFCKPAVERMGGRIAVDTAVGEGTEFIVSLPVHQG